MQKTGRLASDVDLEYLAKRTKNYSGAEIEGLVRSAQSTAMNNVIQVCLSVYLSVCLSVCPSVCLSVCLSV